MNIQYKNLGRALLCVSGGCLAATPILSAQAQTTLATELPAVMVTAEKRASTLELVPASVVVIGGETIANEGLDSLAQLEGRVPGLSFQPFGQAGMNSPVMRGMTANFNAFSTSTLLLVDGVPTLTAQGFENGLLDVDRIEVLRGPQSTLYGRNAQAGVIAIHSQPMDNTPRATATAELGTHKRRSLRFAISQPIVEDTLYASMSGSWTAQDGFIDNIYTGRKEDDRERRNVNLGVRWTPSARTDFVFRYARQEYHDDAALWGAPTSPRAEVASGTNGWNRSKGQSFSLNAAHEFASGTTLRAITGYSDFRDRIQQDTDFMPTDVLHVGRDHHLRLWSQELRLEGTAGASDWLFGLYGDRGDNRLHSTSKRMMLMEDLRATQKSHTLAMFTHWNIPLSAQWTLSAGARVERNSVQLRPEGSDSLKQAQTHFLPKLALQYQINEAHQWYASVSRGVRSGGFNTLAPAMGYLAFSPEKNWAYETGVKGWWLDKRLRYSLAAYVMDIDDMQVMQMPMPGMMYITSAATATSRGIELDAEYLLAQGWTLQAGLAWNRTRFDRFRDGAINYDGKRNPFAPDWTGHVGLRYDAPQGWYAQASLVGTGKVYLDAANQYQRNGYGLVNVAAGYATEHWELSAYVNNVANKRYDAVGYQNGFVTVYSPPRELGLRLTWRM